MKIKLFKLFDKSINSNIYLDDSQLDEISKNNSIAHSLNHSIKIGNK